MNTLTAVTNFISIGGSVVECLTRDRGAAGSSLTGVTVLCPYARHIYFRLELVHTQEDLS